ncbi:5-formyltetrahydrofolate cyclo-ligase [Candidatus Oleimmundimicrobium sp.]|uniref:5-formyltetrahydrofolate cyclo-ligase n=1 Tax=Candidatus Oleimmundimicrobium sp. TaxID=3060597 RepID=UPI00271C6885|nr:5-formyltetrahydrofolate cyclo-ligase [Candidatus Oleimmundimicrobium sp.]MDO8886842.1 5-formyltetrahydrofolate cyclo-ligase [Candidatus Oleimmundimicrobium sp.]
MKRKKLLRQKVLTKRDRLLPEEKREKSRAIKINLFNMREFKQAKTIAFYVSFRSEVETECIIRESLKLGKKVVLPVSRAKDRELQMVYIDSFDDDLDVGLYGILEPKNIKLKLERLDDLDAIILPGSVFDMSGHRLGYGGGYYDRFLQALTSRTAIIGLAYELQVVDEVPNESHDVPVNWLVTEKRVIRCR